MKITATKPGRKNFELFNKLIKDLYPSDSLRFISGNEPETNNLLFCYVLTVNNVPKARYALYNNPDLFYKGKKVICIGSYECVEDDNISKEILNHAYSKAKKLGAEIIIGPMEGSTWANYRFSLSNDIPNFFTEPFHHIYYNKQFTNIGFKLIEKYFSNSIKDLPYDDDFINIIGKKLKDKGLIVRNLDVTDLKNELYNIGAFTIEAFKKNLLYTPLKPEEFVAKYYKLKEYLVPELIFIAEDFNKVIHGIYFGIPDYFDSESKTVIIKSIARKFDTPYKKDIINLLMHKFRKQINISGFENEIHAFMHFNNSSRTVSERYEGKPFKTYGLYGLEIK